MSLQLQVLNGPLYMEGFRLEKNTSIGREGDLRFEDPKMSKTHAFFEIGGVTGWQVRDNSSKNGIKVNGDRVTSHSLVEGDLIEIGGTELRVAAVTAFWKPQLNQLLIEALDKVKNEPMTVYPFRHAPVLTFTQGLQTGQKLILEYGPRILGGESEDIQLFEPLCPDLAFEIHRSPKGVVFVTNYPKVVKLNQKEVEKKLLKKGDQIYIHNTIIEVDFLNL